MWQLWHTLKINFNVLVFGIRATKLAYCLVFLTGLLVVLRKNASTGVLSLSLPKYKGFCLDVCKFVVLG